MTNLKNKIEEKKNGKYLTFYILAGLAAFILGRSDACNPIPRKWFFKHEHNLYPLLKTKENNYRNSDYNSEKKLAYYSNKSHLYSELQKINLIENKK